MAPRSTPWLLLLVPFLSALLVLAWWLPNRPQARNVTMPQGKLESVSFAPYRANESPLLEKFPTAAEAAGDLRLLRGSVAAVRTYSAIEGYYNVAALAQKTGMKVWQGIWLGSDAKKNEEEMARGIAMANRYPRTVSRVIVGNEVLLRRDLTVQDLIADIEKVKRAVRQPVTYADVWEFWLQFPEVAKHVDIVTIHILPYWENHPVPVGEAIAHVEQVYDRIHAMFPGKPIAIGEAGWPSRGRWRGGAAPTLVNEAIFVRRFVSLAAREGFDYNLIEAFDQTWKFQLEGTVGANWGLWSAARRPKFPLHGPVVENPNWPEDAAIGVLAGFVLLAGALWRLPRTRARSLEAEPSESVNRALRERNLEQDRINLIRSCSSARSQMLLAILAMALGAALSFAWAGTVPIIYDRARLISAIVNLAAQAALAALLMHRAALILGGTARPAVRTGLDATATMRDLLCLRFPRARFGRWREWLFDDLSFWFLWTAAVMQATLVFDPRYRDFPLPVFAVPLVAVAARACLADLPASGGEREELVAGFALAAGAVASAVIEGPLNHQALVWNAAALVLALPPLLRFRVRRLSPAAA